MTIIERIKNLCKEKKNISITTLEEELDYSNGSLAKAKVIPSNRILEISKYLDVSMEYLMTGEERKLNKEIAKLDLMISNDLELKKAIEKYYTLDDQRKKHVIELIELLSEI